MVSQDGAMFCLELDWWEFSTLRDLMEEDRAALGRYRRLSPFVLSWNAENFGIFCPVLLVSFGDLQPSVAPGAIWKPLSKFPPPLEVPYV